MLLHMLDTVTWWTLASAHRQLLPSSSAAVQGDAANAGQLTRAAVELAKNWRTDKYLRRLDVR